MKRVTTAIALLPFLAGFAHADVTCRIQQTSHPGESAEVTTGMLYLTPDRLAFQLGTAEGKAGAGHVVFRADKDLLWIIDDAKKEYVEMDKAAADALGKEVAGALATVKAELENLPPEQRAMVEKAMAGNPALARPQAEAATKTEAKKTNERQTVSGFDCTRYDLVDGGEKTGEAWVADPKALGVTARDFAVMEEMSRFFEGLVSSVGQGVQGMDALFSAGQMEKFDGIPILVRDLEGGDVVSEMLIQSVSRGSAPGGTFDVPEGYMKQSLDSGAHH